MPNELTMELGKSVALTILFAVFAVIGLVQILESHLVSGVLIALGSVFLWSVACRKTDFIEAMGYTESA